MCRNITVIALLAFLASCANNPVVEERFVDSLLCHYSDSGLVKTNAEDLAFWKKRFDSLPPDLVNKQKYAQALATRFHFYNDINDLSSAEEIYKKLNEFYKEKEPGILLSLAAYSMLHHRFNAAREYIDKVAALHAEPYAVKMSLSDVKLETGDPWTAAAILKPLRNQEDYNYNFRISKLDHYFGSIDSAIAHMQRAADIAKTPYLKQAALSNVADLYVHSGELNKAYDTYRKCLQLNSSDFHSLSGIGWIALVRDGNTSLANKVFQFVHNKTKSPEPLWRLSQANELTDTVKAKIFARQFVGQVSDSLYGNMYNKYLVYLYTGILNQPAKAVDIATKELSNRATPQTYAWLSWSLAADGRVKEAYDIYQSKVSGQPLETLELFWMGKMMNLVGKKFNANQFFKAAEKNKYDLAPAQQKELQRFLAS